MLEVLRKLFGDAVTDDIMSQFNAELGKRFVAKADYNAKIERIKTLEGEKSDFEDKIKTLTDEAQSAEDVKKQLETLQNDIKTKEREAEQERAAQEKADGIASRFAAVVGDKKFSHAAIEADYLKKFGEALDNKDNQGKSDTEIFQALTKDDGVAFKNVNVVHLPGGTDKGGGAEIDEAKAREVMGLPPAK